MLLGADGKFIATPKIKLLYFGQGSVNKNLVIQLSAQGCRICREGTILPSGAGHQSLLGAAEVTAPVGSPCLILLHVVARLSACEECYIFLLFLVT